MSKKNKFGESTVEKGRILERIVKALQKEPGCLVESPKFLPVISGPKRKKREIDVLVTTQVSHCSVRVAFQCKNQKNSVSLLQVDSFIGALEDVGIPTINGVMVSTNGYSRNALGRAKSAGLRTLLLDGLTGDGLRTVLLNTFQSTVYVFPYVEMVSFFSDKSSVASCQKKTNIAVCILQDTIWKIWRSSNQIPSKIGSYHLRFDIQHGSDGHTYIFNLRNIAVCLIEKVRAEKLSLKNASSGEVEKLLINFWADQVPRNLSVSFAHSETELKEFSRKNKRMGIYLERLKLPRIWGIDWVWPPSEQLFKELQKKPGKEIDPNAVGEGSIDSLFEPPSLDYLQAINAMAGPSKDRNSTYLRVKAMTVGRIKT